MKIGIVTFHRAHNYGAVLQVYALQRYLRNEGFEAEVLDYWPKYHSAGYSFFPRFSNSFSFKGNIRLFLLFSLGIFRILKRRVGYSRFIKEHLKLKKTPKYSTAESTNSANYDIIIYGSDQIWRKHNSQLFAGFDELYFGEYPVTVDKKITYAASMGMINLLESDLIFLKRMMGNYSSISVRETELQDILCNLVDSKISLVLDPVFLIEKENWMTLIPKRSVNNKFILLYQVVSSKESILLADKIQELIGGKVIEIRAKVNPLLVGDRYKQTESPIDFLFLIKNAEFIVTTSFHGVAFSIIFEKQFYSIGVGNRAGRILTLLNSLKLEDRYLNKIEEADITKLINYSNVNDRLNQNIENSKDYLKNALYG